MNDKSKLDRFWAGTENGDNATLHDSSGWNYRQRYRSASSGHRRSRICRSRLIHPNILKSYAREKLTNVTFCALCPVFVTLVTGRGASPAAPPSPGEHHGPTSGGGARRVCEQLLLTSCDYARPGKSSYDATPHATW